jgi:intracellular proteinase inhibitor BsuPI
VAGVSALALGCRSPREGTMQTSGADPLRLELDAPAEVPAGAPVPLRLRLRNTGTQPAVVYLRGREITFDLLISRSDRDTVWRRLAGDPIQAIVQVKRLDPGAEIVLEDRWNQRDRAGRPVTPGDYLVQGVLFTDQPEPLMTPRARLRIRAPA